MRRIVMTAVATVSLAAPSAALAHHGARHHHHHHRGRHHAHVLAFHAQRPASPASGTPSPGSPSAGEESAGTIVSFENGVLTIKLGDGSTVSGKVNERTIIECPAPAGSSSPGQSSFGEREHGDDANFREDDGNPPWDDRGEGDDRHHGCSGHEGDEQQNEHCTTAALVPGASVKEALLFLGGQGATWLKVEL